jgi:hypothetical protein
MCIKDRQNVERQWGIGLDRPENGTDLITFLKLMFLLT